jgi:hypothetical protein
MGLAIQCRRPWCRPIGLDARGGARKRLADKDPAVDPSTRGTDPNSPLGGGASTRQLAAALTEVGHPVSFWTVAQLLRRLGYSLQANRKAMDGTHY